MELSLKHLSHDVINSTQAILREGFKRRVKIRFDRIKRTAPSVDMFTCIVLLNPLISDIAETYGDENTLQYVKISRDLMKYVEEIYAKS